MDDLQSLSKVNTNFRQLSSFPRHRKLKRRPSEFVWIQVSIKISCVQHYPQLNSLVYSRLLLYKKNRFSLEGDERLGNIHLPMWTVLIPKQHFLLKADSKKKLQKFNLKSDIQFQSLRWRHYRKQIWKHKCPFNVRVPSSIPSFKSYHHDILFYWYGCCLKPIERLTSGTVLTPCDP